MAIDRRTVLLGGAMSATLLHPARAREPLDAAAWPSIQAAIDVAGRQGGGVVRVSGAHGLRRPLRLPSGVHLEGILNARLTAETNLPALIRFEDGAAGAGLSGFFLDGAGRTNRLVFGRAVAGAIVEDCRATNYKTAVDFASHGDASAYGIRLRRLFLSEPALGSLFSLVLRSTIAGPLIHDVMLEDVRVEGAGGSYDREGRATADQVVLQGVRDFRLSGITSKRGGEVGITLSRLTGNGIVEDCTASLNDGHGFNMGSGYIAVRADMAEGFTDGRPVKISNGASAIVQRKREDILYLNKVVRGRPEVGDTLVQDGQKATIRETFRTSDITLRRCLAEDNWQDSKGRRRGAGAGFYAQQCDRIFLEDCIARNVAGNTQEYGLLYAQSTVGWRGCTFDGNALQDVRATGRSERLDTPVALPL